MFALSPRMFFSSKCGKKCRGKRRERWQKFVKHIFNEMNLHASTESEGDEGNHSDQCTEEPIGKSQAAKDEKKVYFGGKFISFKLFLNEIS